MFDAGLIDGLVNWRRADDDRLGSGHGRVQTGFVMNYALAMLLGAVAWSPCCWTALTG